MEKAPDAVAGMLRAVASRRPAVGALALAGLLECGLIVGAVLAVILTT